MQLNNVMNDQGMVRKESFDEFKYRDEFRYGLNTNFMVLPKGKQLMKETFYDSNGMSECAKKLQGCTFTKDQYEQYSRCLNRTKEVKASQMRLLRLIQLMQSENNDI